MPLSEDRVKFIVGLISDRLGPMATGDEVKSLASEVVGRLSSMEDRPENVVSQDAIASSPLSALQRKLVLSAVGADRDGLDDKIRLFVAGKALRLLEMKDISADSYKCLFAVIDYSNYQADISKIKFELSSICEDSGFRAIIQDSSYYRFGIMP